ncbi:MAG: O-antigen ligase family protein [Planctomycetes bacterium]|nr:O-antigen ligase family protein [Planctomycetota bacterium]
MTFLILIAVAVGAVWGAYLALRGSLVAGCLLYLVLASCFGPYFWSVDLAGITFSLDRFYLVALCGAFAFQWRLGRTAPQTMAPLDWLLLGLVAWLTLSAFTHDWRSPAVGDVPVIQHLINGYYIPLTLYFLGRRLPLNEASVNGVQTGLAVFGVYLAAIGLLEAAGQWSLVFPRYIAAPELGLHFGRSRGPMVHAVSYGVYLATCLVCVWLWRERVARHGGILLAALIPAFLAALFFTKTRTVWLGAGAAALLTLGLTLKGRVRNAALASMAAAALVVGVAKMDSILGLEREGTVADTRHSADMRKSFTYVSWLMFCDRPIAGFGFGQFASAKLPYLGDRSVDLNLESIRGYVHHNTFLSVLTETGLVGLALFLGVFYHWTRRGWRLARDAGAPPGMRRHGVLWLAVLAIAFWQMLGHEITFTPLDMSLIFFVGGIGVTLAERRMAAASPACREFRPAVDFAFSPSPQSGL